ncbi:hypothetical protein J2S09_001299 [Bacillus fengqiuensis]|nr:hypothetical protein [Bacillus fengqiuensis]
MINRMVEECNFKYISLEDAYFKKNIEKMLYFISFCPFLYKKHPFTYTLRYSEETYVFIVKDMKAKRGIKVQSVKKNGSNIVLEWKYTPISESSVVTKRAKEFTYNLILLEDMPFTNINVDTKEMM